MVDPCPLTPAADPRLFPQEGPSRLPTALRSALAPLVVLSTDCPCEVQQGGEPALAVFSGQNSLHLNLPSD